MENTPSGIVYLVWVIKIKVTKLDLKLHQFIINQKTLLMDELKENNYIIQPKGFQVKRQDEKVYKLILSLGALE